MTFLSFLLGVPWKAKYFGEIFFLFFFTKKRLKKISLPGRPYGAPRGGWGGAWVPLSLARALTQYFREIFVPKKKGRCCEGGRIGVTDPPCLMCTGGGNIRQDISLWVPG